METALLLIPCTGLAYAYWKARCALLTARERLAQSLEERASQAEALAAYRTVMLQKVGGLEKRISEGREVAATILQHRPELFREEHGIAYWLDANDQFLQALHAVYRRYEGQDQVMVHAASAQSEGIFQRVYEVTGLPPPSRA